MTLIDKIHLVNHSDLRYNLTWACGTFIQEVPRRLGQNAALDAAATSLALSHVRYSTGRRDPAPEELKAYGNALVALRNALDEPVIARDANTLCAVMLLLYSQLFIGHSNRNSTGHGEGAAIILKAKGMQHAPKDRFEAQLLMTLRGPLIFEGLFNPRIQLTDDEWTFLVTDHMTQVPDGDVQRMIVSWASFPKLTGAARQVWASKARTATDEFKDLLKSSGEMYSTSMLISDRLRIAYLQSFEDIATAKDEASTHKARFVHAFNHRIYGMGVFTTLYLNCIIRVMLPEYQRTLLRSEANSYAKQIVVLAHHGLPLRPLGSAFMVMCLMVAYLAPIDDSMRCEIEVLWDRYCSDFLAVKDLNIRDNMGSCAFLEDVGSGDL